ncbi:hypothetical protein [Catenovulum adriaticum]|uniref:Uncharacterized protein n=1 Tax=Catenovulum adriaticum TaxID=2984846 RepID=A0ABY7APK6_9ALTE|nr:hypothetical protein [Catenovulum sp. TS8]WAJ70662.1 hypothetical protein OLW01_02280 [Catenovulum sp. TS8]
MIFIKPSYQLFLSLGLLCISPTLLANYEQCIQADKRQTICPHVIIRSIETSNPKYKDKAICICISDFKGVFNKTENRSEQLNSKLEKTQTQYGLSQEDLLKLITGER